MDILRRAFSFVLIFTFSTQGVFAQNLPGAEEVEVPKRENPPGTPSGIQCSIEGERPGINGVCCVGSVLNQVGICDEPTMVDASLVKCEQSSECGSGMACLPQNTSVMFSRLAPTTESVEDIKDNYREFQAHISETGAKVAGESCAHSRECKSYNCVSGKCEDLNVCRNAAEGEVAGTGVRCGPDLFKNVNGICELPPDAKNSVYLGLLKEPTVQVVNDCRFDIPEDSREKSIIAMKSLRAMEYFLSTITVKDQQECFQVMPLMKTFGGSMYDQRKMILQNFTTVLNGIETDFKEVLDAGEKYRKSLESNGEVQQSERTVTVHSEEINETDLGSRVLSGFDAMMIMYRRNILFQSYEKAMLEVVNEIQPKVLGLNKGMETWTDEGTSWDIGTMVVPNYPCEGSKYKKKKLWRWKTKYYSSTKDRWAWQYEITGSAADNASVIKRDKVSKILALLSGYTESSDKAQEDASIKAATDKAIVDFTRPKYYLMDPLMYGGMTHGQYGQTKSLGKKSGFLGFSGFKDLRNARYIRGDSAGSYTRMLNDLNVNVRGFYKTLKTKTDQEKFIYEPELITTSAKDCLDPAKRTEQCSELEGYLNEVAEESFAYFLAYGKSENDSYSGFFQNAETYRRKLLAKLIVDMQNISEYYTTVIKQRDAQNSCLEKVMDGLYKNDILSENNTDGIQQGVAGTNSVRVKGGNLSSLATGTKTYKATSKIPKISKATRTKFQFNLRDSTLKSIADSSIADNVAGSSVDSDRGTVNESIAASLAIRREALQKANQIASAAGVNVSGKDRAAQNLMKSMSRASSIASLNSASLNGKSRGGLGFGDIGKASVSKGDINGSSGPTGEGVDGIKGEIAVGTKGEATDGGNTLGKSLVSDSYNSQDVSNSGVTGAVSPDASGLSEDERERLLAEAERNKKDYRASEEDNLFSKVSKAYVRNLDKVLNRKKKIE